MSSQSFVLCTVLAARQPLLFYFVYFHRKQPTCHGDLIVGKQRVNRPPDLVDDVSDVMGGIQLDL